VSIKNPEGFGKSNVQLEAEVRLLRQEIKKKGKEEDYEVQTAWERYNFLRGQGVTDLPSYPRFDQLEGDVFVVRKNTGNIIFAEELVTKLPSNYGKIGDEAWVVEKSKLECKAPWFVFSCSDDHERTRFQVSRERILQIPDHLWKLNSDKSELIAIVSQDWLTGKEE
jgi:hypothetical protein